MKRILGTTFVAALAVGVILTLWIGSTENAQRNWDAINGIGDVSAFTCDETNALGNYFGFTPSNAEDCLTSDQLYAGRPGDQLPLMRLAGGVSWAMAIGSGIGFLVVRRRR